MWNQRRVMKCLSYQKDKKDWSLHLTGKGGGFHTRTQRTMEKKIRKEAIIKRKRECRRKRGNSRCLSSLMCWDALKIAPSWRRRVPAALLLLGIHRAALIICLGATQDTYTQGDKPGASARTLCRRAAALCVRERPPPPSGTLYSVRLWRGRSARRPVFEVAGVSWVSSVSFIRRFLRCARQPRSAPNACVCMSSGCRSFRNAEEAPSGSSVGSV